MQRFFALLLCLASPVSAETVSVFAAASLQTALDKAGDVYEEATGDRVRVTYAGTATLARQIALGAPADLFISANGDWMDWLAGEVPLQARAELLGNRLVLVAPAHARSVALEDLPAALGDGRLAIGLTASVPAGIYGRQALEALGLWEALHARLAQTDNVRIALALVARGEAPFGVVYATDAMAEPAVTVVAEFPAGSHDPITYPAALVTDDPAAAAFLDWLQGAEASAIFAEHGFEVPK